MTIERPPFPAAPDHSTGRSADRPADHRDDRQIHLRAWEILPWLVNGRATPDDAAWVAAHVSGCDDCRSELAWQQRLHDAIAVTWAQTSPADPSHDPSPDPLQNTPAPAVEAGLQRLLARLDDAAEPASFGAAVPARGGHRLTWALAAAVVVQAIGLGVMSLQLASDGDPGGRYQTLSTPPAPAADNTMLRVLPDAAMSLAQWQGVLSTHRLQVVAGPNTAGAYGLAPAPGATATPTLLARLRATPGIRLAEPIGSPR